MSWRLPYLRLPWNCDALQYGKLAGLPRQNLIVRSSLFFRLCYLIESRELISGVKLMFIKCLAVGVFALLWIPGLYSFSIAQQSEQVTNTIGMKFRLIPNGTFMMGSKTSEKHSGDDETEHKVTISQPFYLGIYEVTQGQYLSVIGENPSSFQGESAESRVPSKKDPQTGRIIEKEKVIPKDTSMHPVEEVGWNEAFEFCKRLSALPAEQKAGRTYRLPREAEWEYACRAGTEATYFFGDNPDSLAVYAWCEENSRSEYGTNPWQPQSVGTRKPNPWGLYDMLGNVEEWCMDWYGEYPAEPVTDPSGPAGGDGRVVRGGRFIDNYQTMRCARRGYGELARSSCGFRVVMFVASDRGTTLASNLVGKWELDADESKKLVELSSDLDVEALRQLKITFEFLKDDSWVISGSTGERKEGQFEIVDSNPENKTVNVRMNSEDGDVPGIKVRFIKDDLILIENEDGSFVFKRADVPSSRPSSSVTPPLKKLQIGVDELAKLNQFLALEREVDGIIKENNILVAERLPDSEVGDEHFVYLKSGTSEGAVWGSGPYTLDSNLRSAAIHAGVLPREGSGIVRVVCVKSPGSFSGSSRNGVSSSSYGSYGKAFQIYGLAGDSDVGDLK